MGDRKRIHLIGICGTAMATLAALLKNRGFDVRGSDQNVYPPMSDFLAQQGITILLVTHERDIAEYATRIVTFRDGRVLRDQPVTARRDAVEELAALDAQKTPEELTA